MKIRIKKVISKQENLKVICKEVVILRGIIIEGVMIEEVIGTVKKNSKVDRMMIKNNTINMIEEVITL